MTCCYLVIKIWTVSTLLFELFQHKSLFIHVTSCESTASVISINSPCLCSNFKTGRFVVDQAPASAPVPNQKLIHLHSPCLHTFFFFITLRSPTSRTCSLFFWFTSPLTTWTLLLPLPALCCPHHIIRRFRHEPLIPFSSFSFVSFFREQAVSLATALKPNPDLLPPLPHIE